MISFGTGLCLESRKAEWNRAIAHLDEGQSAQPEARAETGHKEVKTLQLWLGRLLAATILDGRGSHAVQSEVHLPRIWV